MTLRHRLLPGLLLLPILTAQADNISLFCEGKVTQTYRVFFDEYTFSMVLKFPQGPGVTEYVTTAEASTSDAYFKVQYFGIEVSNDYIRGWQDHPPSRLITTPTYH